MNSLPVLAILALTALGSVVSAQQGTKTVRLASPESFQQQQVLPAIVASGTDDNDDTNLGTITTSSIKAMLKGVDTDALSVEHETFLEDAMGFAFDKIHKKTDKKMISSRLIGKMVDKDHDDGGIGDDQLVRGAADGLGYGRKYWKYWSSQIWYVGATACQFCTYDTDARLLSATESLLSTDALEAARIKERWEIVFCKTLVDSAYEVFDEAHDCTFIITHNDHVEDPELLAAKAQSPLWRAKAKNY